MQIVSQAFTARANSIASDLRSTLRVSAAGSGQEAFPEKQWEAIWDTGATASVISRSIVDHLQFKPVSMQRVKTA